MRLPKSVVRIVAGVAEAIGNLSNTKPWLTRELVARAGAAYYFSCAKAQRELGYTVTSFRTAAENAFQWYKKNGFLS